MRIKKQATASSSPSSCLDVTMFLPFCSLFSPFKRQQVDSSTRVTHSKNRSDRRGFQNESHSYWKAMDGDPDSYFCKDARSVGYVGIDIGPSHKASLSRIRFCPRSDTNFILQGDEYELRYWQDGNWHTFGTQMATTDSLVFTNVPSGTLYWLRDLTKGKEERPFTYENGKQVWW